MFSINDLRVDKENQAPIKKIFISNITTLNASTESVIIISMMDWIIILLIILAEPRLAKYCTITLNSHGQGYRKSWL